MIRKNIYLTEKQIAFITEFIKKEGGGTETDVVRKALEEFIQQRESKFGFLQGMRIGGLNLKDIYIEISPRGTGKTYRLVKHATQYLEYDSKNKVNIIVPTERCGKNIKRLIGEYFKNRIFVNEKIISDNELNIKCYYDEFDYNNNLREVDLLGYYCTTPSKIRYLKDLDSLKKDDFLIKILVANEGKYVTNTGVHLFDSSIINFVMMDNSQSIEFNNNWLRIK